MRGNIPCDAGRRSLVAALFVLLMLPAYNLMLPAYNTKVTPGQAINAVNGGEDPVKYRAPTYITANAGQWDHRVRYAIVAERSAAWFASDGVTLLRPASGIDLPVETATGARPAHRYEQAMLGFVEPSPRMRLRVLDTAMAVSHFHQTPDSTGWRTAVTNHRVLRYEQVWEGIDIEYAATASGGLRQTVRIAPGADASAIRFRGGGSGGAELVALAQEALAQEALAHGAIAPRRRTAPPGAVPAAEIGAVPAAGGGFRYKDTLCLTAEFNTAFQYATSPEGIVVSADGRVTISGTIDRDVLPVRNAVQDRLEGGFDLYVLQFDPTGQDIVFCTYIGGLGWDEFPKNMTKGFNKRVFGLSGSGHVVGCFNATEGAPLTPRSYRAWPTLNVPQSHGGPRWTSYIYSLGLDGTLYGSTYLGGPGPLEPMDLHVEGEAVFLAAWNRFDTLQDISRDAVMATKDKATDGGLVLAKLPVDCSDLHYMTYIVTHSWIYDGNHVDYGNKTWGQLTADRTGEAIVAMGARGNLGMSTRYAGLPDTIGAGIWVLKLGSGGNSVRFSRLFDREFPGENRYSSSGFGVTSVFAEDDGGIALFGQRYIAPDEALPPKWTQRRVIEATAPSGRGQSIWSAKLNGSGDLLHGSIYGDFHGFHPYHDHVERDHTCGGYMMFLWSNRQNVINGWTVERFHPLDEVDTSRDASLDRHLVSIGEDLAVRYATRWNSAYYVNGASGREGVRKQYHVDRHGYAYQYTGISRHELVRRFYRSWRLPRPADPAPAPYYECYLSRFRIHTPCWQVGCAITTIDSLRLERRRGYIEPEVFTVDYAVTNHSPGREARIMHASIELPPGLRLSGGTPVRTMTPSVLAPGQSAQCSWTITVDGSGVLPDTALIRCRVFYVDPESGQTYPMGEELCEKHILLRSYDEPDADISCLIEGPEHLYWVGNGYAETAGGVSAPIRYTATFTNHEADTLEIPAFRIDAGAENTIVGGPDRPGVRLAPGAVHVIAFDLRAARRAHARALHIAAEALDGYMVPIKRCERIVRLPDAFVIPCTVTGPVHFNWNVATGAGAPAEGEFTLALENPLDTVRSDMRAWVDLTTAPHLAAASGDSLTRPAFFIAPDFRRLLTWRLVVVAPPAMAATDTVRFFYTWNGITGSCEIAIEIRVIDETLLCTLQLPEVHTSPLVESREPIPLDYTLSNVGTVPADVDRLELAIDPVNSGLVALDPVTQPGSQLAAGGSLPWNTRLRAAIRRETRTATCTVTAYGRSATGADSVLSVCDATITIEGVDGLRCTITAPDSVRFERDSLRYDPDPMPLHMDLSNVLDTEETVVEAEIDLTSAPRFELATGESTMKTLSLLDSHSVASFTWLLVPLGGTTDDNQDIVIRYRSAEQGSWKECATSIVIAAWPQIAEVRCATSGHDSLFADAAYEAIVPEPLQVSYTATNSGTVTLTGCTAAIVLPPGFVLAGSDSIQTYGTLAHGAQPPGTLAPNESATRWWTLSTTDALTGFGPQDITWQWTSDQQGSTGGCTHTVQLVPDPSSGIVLTPLRLYFEAELGGALPPAQSVQLWTGGGLSMPWMATSDAWYIDLDPVAGDRAVGIAVRPNTTMLNKGMHTSTLTVGGSAVNIPKYIAVDYLLTSLTGVGEQPSARTLMLGPVYPHPIPLAGEARLLLGNMQAQPLRVTLHDLLGRERAVLREGVTTDDEILYLRPSALGLAPGSYLLRVLSPDGQQSRMVTVVR